MHNFDTDPVVCRLRDIVRHDLGDSSSAADMTTTAPHIPSHIIGMVALLALAASTCLLAFCSAQTENELLTQELTTCTELAPPPSRGRLGGGETKLERIK